MDKIDYFLFLKKKHTSILQYLKEIHNTYVEIIDSEETMGKKKEYEISARDNCKKQINELEYHIQTLQSKIENICDHNFFIDEIDITPEKSRKIKYCSICEYTCKN